MFSYYWGGHSDNFSVNCFLRKRHRKGEIGIKIREYSIN